MKGKVVAITGASSGIGAASALLLADRGAKVALGARRVEHLERLAARITHAGGEAAYLKVDVRRREDNGTGLNLESDVAPCVIQSSENYNNSPTSWRRDTP